MAEARSERRVGPYALLERVGRGGMGEVHIAQRDGASTLCVLKQLRESAEGDHLYRLKREAHVLSQLAHPHIGALIDAGVDGDTFYLALELIPGETLRRILGRVAERRKRFPPEIAIQIASEVLDGLSYAHDQRDAEGRPLELVHRDLSPNNVMLSYEGRTKIIDFGIASGKLDEYRTMPGTILGTMRYISPEQALSKPVDRRCDIYTLGVVLYEMLTGIPVVEKGDQAEILDAVLRRRPPPFSQIAPHLPSRLWLVVAKAIEKRAMDRFDTAAAFRTALLEASKGLSLPQPHETGRFLTEFFPESLERSSRILAPDESTNSIVVEELSSTDRSEASDTASDEQQPTQIDSILARSTRKPPATIPGKPRRSLNLPLAVVAGATAMTALVMALPDDEPRVSPPIPTVESRPRLDTPKIVQLDPEPDMPRSVYESAPVEKKAVRRPAIKAPPEPAPSELRRKLEALRQTPDDVPLMTQLHAGILRESRALPAPRQAAIKAEVDAALRVVDVDGMARALDMLERALSE